ncbi:MAG: prolipoprotein diacylglyceryl transferase [Janthinobacterium lividum]
MFPVLFHIGSFVVHTYGVVLMVAFLVALGRAYAVAKRQNDPGTPPDNILDVGIWMIVIGVLGARLMFVAIGWNDYRHAADFPGNIFKVWEGGLSFHGGLFGGFAALVSYCLIKRMSILKVADLFGPSVMIAYAIGRVGCFLNGCCYGAPTNMPWGVRFFDDGQWTVPSHPTQLYASALSLVFFAGLIWLERHRAYLGQVACWYLLGAATERFLMEIWRAGTTSDIVRVGPIHVLTDVQWLCLGLAVIALSSMAILRRKYPVPPIMRSLPPRPLEATAR